MSPQAVANTPQEVGVTKQTATAGVDHHEKGDSVAKNQTKPPNLHEAVASLTSANWTSVIRSIRSPSNRGYVVGMSMVASLTLCIAGYRLIKIWLFLGGFISLAAAFYFLSPNVFQTTFCCGENTEEAHLLISAVCGLVGGVLALWILKIGVFLTGSCLGLAASLALRSIIGHLHLFQTDLAFAVFYACSGLSGGIIALYKEKPVIVTITALFGSFAFFLGVGFFAQCNFMAVIQRVEQSIDGRVGLHPTPLEKCHRILAGCFLALTCVGIFFQYKVTWSTSPTEVGGLPLPKPHYNTGHDNPQQLIVVREVLHEKSRRKRGKKKHKRPKERQKTRRRCQPLTDSESENESFISSRSCEPTEYSPAQRRSRDDQQITLSRNKRIRKSKQHVPFAWSKWSKPPFPHRPTNSNQSVLPL
eukprot:m.101211 g.101211  ORF g.101211 m.101211 type:complete len:417 (+) comp22274_c0_seq1:252-1502(+)